MTKTLDDIKREADIELTDVTALDIRKVINHLHSQGLLMVWNTDMDSAPDGFVLIKGGLFDTDDQSDGMKIDDDVVHQAIHLTGDVWNTPYGYNVRKPMHWMPLPKWKEGE